MRACACVCVCVEAIQKIVNSSVPQSKFSDSIIECDVLPYVCVCISVFVFVCVCVCLCVCVGRGRRVHMTLIHFVQTCSPQRELRAARRRSPMYNNTSGRCVFTKVR